MSLWSCALCLTALHPLDAFRKCLLGQAIHRTVPDDARVGGLGGLATWPGWTGRAAMDSVRRIELVAQMLLP
jgi:hypothetical protein